MHRDSTDNLHIYKITSDNNYTDIINTVSANSYDSLVYNDELYVLSYSIIDNTSALNIYDGTNWRNGAGFSTPILDPSITIIDGELNALLAHNNANKDVYAYRYENNSWAQEGEKLESISGSIVTPTLTKIGDMIGWRDYIRRILAVECRGKYSWH